MVPVFCALVLAFGPMPDFAGAADDEEARAAVRGAIDSIRGVSLDGLSAGEMEALGDRLDAAWRIMSDHEKLSEKLVREVLAAETEDSFLIIDLASFLMGVHEGKPSVFEEVSGYLTKADPNAYSRSYFEIVSYMASRHCQVCLPAILKILEVRDLDGYIQAHALPVGTELGLVFTVAQYGDALIDRLGESLASDDCTVRGNSALALADLAPARIPQVIERMAVDDTCAYARSGAWQALMAMQAPSLGELLEKRFSQGPVGEEEAEAVAYALSTLTASSARRRLEGLMDTLDDETADMVKKLVERGPVGKGRTPGSAKSGHRRRILSALKKAVKSGQYDGPTDAEQIFVALTPSDVKLINEARAALLRRLSDECLYEWYPLTAAANALRAHGR